MPEFRFRAIDSSGKVVHGRSSADDAAGLTLILQGQGLFLMESEVAVVIDEEAAKAQEQAARGLLSRDLNIKLPRRKRKITLKDLSFLTSQLSIMVRSALPILDSIELLAAQASTPELKVVLLDIQEAVSEGLPLSKAFARHPKVFDEVYVSLVAAGEVTGDLDAMLQRLASHLNFQVKLRSSIRSVLAYPVIVVLVSVAVVAFIVMFVLPTFAEVFVELGIDLPWPTRVLLFCGDMVRGWWHAFSAALVMAFLGFKHWLKHPDNERKFNLFLLDFPVIGSLMKNIILTRTLRTMGSLIESGIPVIRALELCRAAAGNVIFADLMDRIGKQVHSGKLLSECFAESRHIPRVVVGMLATGERTGTLPEVISRVAEFYESETETSIKDLFAAIEPLFIVGLGVMVGAMAISVLLPMFDMAQGIK